MSGDRDLPRVTQIFSKDKIILIVPIDYLFGVFKMELPFTIHTEHNLCNYIGFLQISSGYMRDGVFESSQSNSATVCSGKAIVQQISHAFRYFGFVNTFLEKHKTNPPTFEEFQKKIFK
ncbi:MAG: hypothetical protein KGI50_04155 [Patescibacteria group bacterium]|nr:hypothetical protein [Patescibacteria group bacterium]MDE2438521.1 hypothetical protein [Patescibacteria group bacterium]